MAIQPGSQVALTMSELRSTSSHQWDARKRPSIFATETGGKWNPPPDDPSLSIHENRKNLLIRRALKWPLLTSGYESPESFEAAKLAEARMDVAVEYYLAMYRAAPDYHGEYMLAEIRELLLIPARAALGAAVKNLNQPALIPSRIGSVASVVAPVEPGQVSSTKPTSATVVTQEQQPQSLGKKTSGHSGLQSPELSSPSMATAISSKPRSHLEKLPAKTSSTKTSPVKSNPSVPSSSKAIKSSPAKTSQAQPVVPSPTKAPAKKSPTKAILPPSSTPSATPSVKASPTKTAPAKPSLLSPNKAPAVVSKSQTQPEKAIATKSPAKSSLVKLSPSPSASSPRKDSAEVSGSQKKQRTGWIDLSAVQSRFLSPVSTWSSEARIAVGEAQIERFLASTQRSRKKRCLPSSPTSTSSSGSEASSSSPNPSQFPSPSPLQPKAKTITKGKAPQILSKGKATAGAERSLASSPVETQEVVETDNRPSTPPKTPARQADMALQLQIQIGLEEMQSSLRKLQRAKADTDSAMTGQMAHVTQMISLLIKAREAAPGSSSTPLTIDED